MSVGNCPFSNIQFFNCTGWFQEFVQRSPQEGRPHAGDFQEAHKEFLRHPVPALTGIANVKTRNNLCGILLGV